MAPQPLYKFRKSANVDFESWLFEQRPKHAALIVQTIAHTSKADAHWAHIMADLFRSQGASALAAYHALTGGEARRAALLGAAEQTCSAQDYKLVAAVYQATKTARKIRNDFAHHMWGQIEGENDALLLMDPKDLAQERLELFGKSKRKSRVLHAAIMMHDLLDRRKIWVYRLKDLKEAEEAAFDASCAVYDLMGLLLNPSHPSIRPRLSSRPLVKLALQRMTRETIRARPPRQPAKKPRVQAPKRK